MIAFNRSKNSVYRLLLGAALLLSGSAAHAQAFTNIIDPANPTFTQALGINGSNTIVGYGNATNFDGFVLTLPPVPGNFTRENFPNSSPPPITLFTQVTGIDAAGDTVGFYVANPAVGTTNGFLKPAGGSFATVNQPGSVFNQLLGINQAGNEIAGYSSFTDPAGMTGQEAFSLVTGTTSYTDINALLVAKFGPNLNSQATGVNNGGWVVGFYQPTSTTFDGFVDESGAISSITFPGSVDTQALGVNDLGEIVGDYTIANGDMFGFLDNGGVFSTIDPGGSTAVTANGINDLGHIVGFYTAADGNTIGFEASVPEPSTWAMLLLGFAGLGFLSYRKVRQGTLAAA
jgi:PEP-CTERM motif